MKRTFRSGDKTFSMGPFIKCPHPEVIETCALAGFDFAVVDMEHTPLGPRDLYPLVLAAEARGLDLIVRIPERSEPYFKWCRDLGVRYIQVPFVQSADDARESVSRTFFSPEGTRGLCRFVRAANFSTTGVSDYLTQANAACRLILQIEGAEGVRNIDSILETPHLDTLFLGPYDLSQSLGKPGQIWDKAVVSTMKAIVDKCRAKEVRVGTFTDTPEGVAFWTDAGVEVIEYASDLNLFASAAQALKQAIARGKSGKESST